MGTSSRIGLAWQLGAALVVGASGARAEPSAARDRLIAQAGVAVKEGRFADSREAWMAVWKLDRSQEAACNIGALSYRIGEAKTAVRWLSLCKAIMRPPQTAVERAVHQSRLVDLARARQLVGELKITAPAGATVTVDGQPIDAERGDTVPVDPGHRVVRATLRGATTAVEIDVPRGETREVTLAFDDALKATRPAVPRAQAKSRPEPSGLSPAIVIGGIAATTVFLSLGTGLHVFANAQEDRGFAYARQAGPNGCYDDTTPPCRRAEELWSTTGTSRGVGTTALVIGGAVAVGTVAYIVFPRQRAEVRAAANGVAVSGTW